MLEVIVSIILIPVAICAVLLTVSIGVGIVKYFNSKESEKS